MHNIDMDLIAMTMDVMKYVIHRITHTDIKIGSPQKESLLKEEVGETITPKGIGGERAFQLFKEVLVPATVPIDHPRHLAFVPASPTRASIMFDLVTAASSIHGSYWMEGAGGIFCEMEAMRWLVSITGLPASAFGVFTSGGTAANLSALVTARHHWRSIKEERKSLRGLMITSTGAHSSVEAMARVMDVELKEVFCEEDMKGSELQKCFDALSAEEQERTFAVIATAGTTNAGIIDDLQGIADVCKEKGLWLHVDAAYGGGALLSPKTKPLFVGIERSDSITIDPHKWFFSPYDCGAVIYRNPKLAKAAHTQEGSYLDIFQDEGSRGFNPSEYQIQLTRRLRGLPLWFSLATHGTDRYRQAVEKGLEMAEISQQLIHSMDHVEMVRPIALSCVLFRRKGWNPDDYTRWTYDNHKKGYALVAPTQWKTKQGSERIARFCFINPDTTKEDIVGILESMK